LVNDWFLTQNLVLDQSVNASLWILGFGVFNTFLNAVRQSLRRRRLPRGLHILNTHGNAWRRLLDKGCHDPAKTQNASRPIPPGAFEDVCGCASS
jgi:hypothetical protein